MTHWSELAHARSVCDDLCIDDSEVLGVTAAVPPYKVTIELTQEAYDRLLSQVAVCDATSSSIEYDGVYFVGPVE